MVRRTRAITGREVNVPEVHVERQRGCSMMNPPVATSEEESVVSTEVLR